MELYQLISMSKGVFDRFWRNLLSSQKVEQTCFYYCPSCGLEMASAPDIVVKAVNGRVFAHCSCHCQSVWDFDAPAPLLLYHYKWSGGVDNPKEGC